MLVLKNKPNINVFSKQYPVGQGGLHLSIIECYNPSSRKLARYAYIYDCGDSSKTSKNSLISFQIDNLFDDIYLQFSKDFFWYRRDQLDKLYIFISHLHQDHCNGLLYLKKCIQRKQISETKPCLMLPYMPETEMEILIRAYEEDEDFSKSDYEKFIRNPEDFFEGVFDVIYITANEEDSNSLYNDKMSSNCNTCNGDISTITDSNDRKFINHNQEIRIGNSEYYWVLRAFCNPIAPETLDYIRKNVENDINDISKEIIEHNKSIYKQVVGEHNLSSICLYSGPCSNADGEGFMHTGDAKLLKKNVYANFKAHYYNYLKNVCVAQIPHHGSEKDSNLKTFRIFQKLKLLYVTKQELTNGSSYPRLSSEYDNKNFVKEVSEKPSTALIFENFNVFDYIFYNDKTICFKNRYKDLEGILKFEDIGERKYADELLSWEGYYVTCSPKNPIMLTSDKLLFLVVFDGNKNEGPKIIGRARTFGFNPNNLASKKMLKAHPYIDNYKYYVQLYDVEVIDDEIKNGILLYDVIEHFGLSMFPNTKATNPYMAYSQQSYREISDDAKDYINDLLNKRDLKKNII